MISHTILLNRHLTASICIRVGMYYLLQISLSFLRCNKEQRGGKRVSHMTTLLPSDECPAVARKLLEPIKTKSFADLLWHGMR